MRKQIYMFFMFVALNAVAENIPVHEVKKLVHKECDGVNKKMAMSIIKIESSFQNIESQFKNGGVGLMQVLPSTAKELNCGLKKKSDLFNINVNVKCGCAYLRKQTVRYNHNMIKIIASYKDGSYFEKNGKPISYDYVNKVLKDYYGR